MAPSANDTVADVLVLGAGLAGYCAALEAAQYGAEVLMLEKQPRQGGSTVLSAGFVAFAGTPLQQAEGLDDNTEIMLADLRAAGKGECDESLLAVYAAEQAEAYDWIQAHGVKFGSVHLSSAHSVPRAHQSNPVQMIRTLSEAAEKTGRITLVTGAAAKRLLRDGDGAVTGVQVELDGEERHYTARRGVVIATGGFSRSEEMLKAFVPHQAMAVRYGGKGNTGDGIRMAWDLGAGLSHMAHVKGTFGLHPDCQHVEGRDWTKLAIYRGGIAVNKSGLRYVDESLSYKLLGDAVLTQEDGLAFQIFDQKIMDGATPGVAPFDFAEAMRRGLLHKADSLQDLAGMIGVDPKVLAGTVARYNAGVDAGVDEDFGRDGLSNHYGARVRIDAAPFYAYPSTSTIIATYAGVTSDAQSRVRSVFDEVIPNLYVAGEAMGGFHGVAYMTGSSLGKCLIFGRIAGRNAASSRADATEGGQHT